MLQNNKSCDYNSGTAASHSEDKRVKVEEIQEIVGRLNNLNVVREITT